MQLRYQKVLEIRDRIAENRKKEMELINEMLLMAWYESQGINPTDIVGVKPRVQMTVHYDLMIGLSVLVKDGSEVELPCPPPEIPLDSIPGESLKCFRECDLIQLNNTKGKTNRGRKR